MLHILTRKFVSKLILVRSRGLVIDDELWHGQSQKSETFQNEPLAAGQATEFDCVAVEVLGFKSAI